MSEKTPGLSYEAHKKLEAERTFGELAIVAGTAVAALVLLLRLLPIWGPALVAALLGGVAAWGIPRRAESKPGVAMVVVGVLGVVFLSMVVHDLSRLRRIGRSWNPRGFRVDATVLGQHATGLVVWGLPWLLIAAGVMLLWRAYRARGVQDHAHDLGDGELVIRGH
jgi:hypothetical protein